MPALAEHENMKSNVVDFQMSVKGKASGEAQISSVITPNIYA